MSGIDNYTKLLLHCDGADASTTFTDSSLIPKTVTRQGDAQIDTAQYKFGGASGLFDGTGDYLTVAQHNDFNFSASNWTIDFWFRIANVATESQGLAGSFGAPAFGLLYNYSGNGKMLVDLSSNGSTWNIVDEGLGTKSNFASNTWYHYAFTWDGATYRGFVDGVLDYSFVSATGIYGTIGIYIGIFDGTNFPLPGWIDEIRVSKGIARWTANFTPPTQPYSKAVGGGLGIGNPYIF